MSELIIMFINYVIRFSFKISTKYPKLYDLNTQEDLQILYTILHKFKHQQFMKYTDMKQNTQLYPENFSIEKYITIRVYFE